MMILFSDSFREELNAGGVWRGSPPRQPKKRAEANPEKIFMQFGTFSLQNLLILQGSLLQAILERKSEIFSSSAVLRRKSPSKS